MASLSERVAAAKETGVSFDSQREKVFREMRGKLHFRIVEELGPTLYDRQMSDAELRLRVMEMLEWAIDQEESVPLSSADRAQLLNEIASDVLGYGPIDPLLNDADVTEVMVNGPHSVYVERDGKLAGGHNFSVCLMLGIAYAASIGGVATLIGTPPNVVLAGYCEEIGREISMSRWLIAVLPLTLVFLVCAAARLECLQQKWPWQQWSQCKLWQAQGP